MTPKQQQQIRDWFAAIGRGDNKARAKIKALLDKLNKSWNDLPDIVKPDVSPRSGLESLMASPQMRTKKWTERRDRIRGFFGMMGSSGDGESDNAESFLKNNLMQLALMWDDLPWLIQPDHNPQQASASTSASTQHPFTDPDAPPPLAVLVRLVEQYVAVTPHQPLTCALWAMHSFIYDRYSFTPRLFITSPVEGCGKSTLLKVLERLVRDGDRHVNITTAALYRDIDANPDCTRLLDEGENLNGLDMRYVLNGNQPGDKVTRTVQGRPKSFYVFAPIAFAAIGTMAFHSSALSRSIEIKLQRCKRAVKLRQFDPSDTHALEQARAYAHEWLERENISRDPPMPELDSRVMNNWRPLIAIADASGGDWGAQARAAMLALSASSSANVGIMLLEHVRILFDRGAGLIQTASGDVIPTATLLEKLHTLDEADGHWRRYCGPHGAAAPRKLTEHSLSALLRPFDVFPDQYRPLGGGKQFRGYARASFKDAWESYCSQTMPPPLRLVASRDDDE
jgi:hypothetical protein